MSKELWTTSFIFTRARYPRREGSFWSAEEIKDVREAFKADIPIRGIATYHERDPWEIEQQRNAMVSEVTKRLLE